MGTGEAEGDKRAIDRRRSGDLQSADRRCLDEGRQGAAHLHHRRPRPHALRSRRSGDPHPRGSRSGRQHHRRRDLRRKPRRHHPRFRGRHRHRSCRWRSGRGCRRPRRASPRSRTGCVPTTSGLRNASSEPSRCAAPLRRRPPLRRAGVLNASIESWPRRRSRRLSCRRAPGPESPSVRWAKAVAVHRSARQRAASPGAGSLYSAATGADAARALRMPRIDELPVPAQNEIRARRGELPGGASREAADIAVAAAGRGRSRPPRAGDEEAAAMPRGAPAAHAAHRRAAAAGRRAARRDVRQPRRECDAPEPVSEYAKRPAPQGLDQHGRQMPVHNRSEEDQLDIPAFLRRQAN